jgi:peptidyl-dipeptidase Dcp
MRALTTAILLFMTPMVFSCNSGESNTTEQSATTDNPLFAPSTLPLQAPAFDKIKETHFKPAIEKGMSEQLAEWEAIANNTEAPSFDNTFIALEKSGSLLGRTMLTLAVYNSANTNDYLQQLEEETSPKIAAHSDAMYLNNKLFQRVAQLHEKRTTLNLDPESIRLIENYYIAFVKAGANLSEADKTTLKKINEEEASLTTKFSNQLLKATKDGGVYFNDKDALAGLSSNDLDAAAEAAKVAKKSNQWLIELQNTTQQPVFQSLSNRESRSKIFDASWNRTEKGDANDTRKIVLRLAQLRAEKAALLGFDNYAAWNLQDQMAKTPAAVKNFFNTLIPAAAAKAKLEAKDIEAVIAQEGGSFSLAPYDWDYYADKVKKAKYNVDENTIKPYFSLDSVLKNGVFYAANQLFGITFKERKDIPVYHKDVKVYEVIDQDGSTLALFYTDFFKRDNKIGGAWMSNFVEQSTLLGTKPVIYNVCNYTKPAEGQPALISFDDVTTTFHEFGHAIHGIFAKQKYARLSGTNVPRDFVEFPSQFFENWALYPSILKNYAKHYKTGETIPDSLIAKIKAASTFNQGYAITEVLAAADLDLHWHTINAKNLPTDVDAFEKEALIKSKLDISYVPPRYRSSFFAHIWGGGYAAGYYAYLWTEMLDHDAFQWFEENGGLTRENGQRYRDMILSKGNSMDCDEMYKAFRGKAPVIDPMLKKRGLK